MARNTDHVVCCDDGHEDPAKRGHFWCRHCDAKERAPMGVSVYVFAEAGRSFTKAHARCTKPKVDDNRPPAVP